MEVNNMSSIRFGQSNIRAVYFGGEQIWPQGYYAIITPVLNTSSNVIPVTGGSVSLHWEYSIYRTSGGSAVSSGTVSDPQNIIVTRTNTNIFSFSTSGSTVTVSANTRGTNGYGTSGTVIPQSAPAWSTEISAASYSMTYDGRTVPASYSGSFIAATQPANNVSIYGNPSYSNIVLTINDFTSSATKAAASGGSTTWSVSGTKLQQYEFTTTDIYTYSSSAVSDLSVTSAETWAHPYSSGTFTIDSRTTNPGDERSAVISAKVNTTIYASVTVYQQLNQVEQTIKTYDDQTYITNLTTQWGSLAANTAPSAGGTGTISYIAQKHFTSEYVYTSTSHGTGPSGYDTVTIGNGVVVDEKPSWISSVSDSGIVCTQKSKYSTTDSTGYLTLRVYYSTYSYKSQRITLTQKGTVITYSLECHSHPSGVSLPAYAQTVNLTFYGYTHYDNGDADDVSTNAYGSSDSGNTPVVEQGITRISPGAQQVIGGNLGTTPLSTANVTYTYYWSGHSTATCQVPISQSYNRIESSTDPEWTTGTVIDGQPTTTIVPNSYVISADYSPNYSSSNPAPSTNAGTISITNVDAHHQTDTAIPWSREDYRDVDNTWTSTAHSITHETNPVTGTRHEYNNVPDTPTVTVSPSTMLSYTTTSTGYSVTITDNSGGLRNGLVSLTNNTATPVYIYVYQRAGNVSLSASVSQLSFIYTGGTQTFTITARSTDWTISTVSDTTRSPFVGGSISPTSGTGSSTGTTTTVTVYIAEHQDALSGGSNRRGRIIITPTSDDVSAIEIDVLQSTAVYPD